jgi:ATP-binding cassette subfamily C protein
MAFPQHDVLSWADDPGRSQKRTRPRLLKGNLIALLAVVCSVPVPLFLPVLVDEVLLNKPGGFIAFFSPWFPAVLAWPGAVHPRSP